MRITAAAFTICLAMQAQSEPATEVEEAGLMFSIANICRSAFGEKDLFDAAYDNFVSVIESHGHDADELEEIKANLIEGEDMEMADNPFARAACDGLREILLPT